VRRGAKEKSCRLAAALGSGFGRRATGPLTMVASLGSRRPGRKAKAGTLHACSVLLVSWLDRWRLESVSRLFFGLLLQCYCSTSVHVTLCCGCGANANRPALQCHYYCPTLPHPKRKKKSNRRFKARIIVLFAGLKSHLRRYCWLIYCEKNTIQ